MQLVELGKTDAKAITDLLQDHIAWMEKQGKAPQYIKGTVTAVKSWLEHFDIALTRKIRVANINATPTLQDERVPEGAELAELSNRGSLRAGASMALIAKAGLRPEVLGNVDASDGLMIKDLPDLKVINGWATFVNKPARILVRSTLSKAKHEYFTFITDLGAKRLLTYLNERIANGQVLTPESPAIAAFADYPRFRGSNKQSKFIETPTITAEIRDCMKPRFNWRPYVLRAFFDTQLLIAESKGQNDTRLQGLLHGTHWKYRSEVHDKQGQVAGSHAERDERQL
jgi:hypothetical protein